MKKTGDEYFDSRRFHELLNAYEYAVGIGMPPFADADELTDIADYYQFIGEKKKAMDVIELALKLYPGATLPLVFLIHEDIDREDEKAAWKHLSQIADHNDLEYIFAKAECNIATFNMKEAENVLERRYVQTTDKEERDSFAYDSANLYMQYGEPNYALGWLKRSDEKDSEEYKELMGRILVELENYDDSEKIYNELIDHNPYSTRYWNALSNIQFMKNNTQEAISSSEYAMAIDPDDTESILNKAFGLYDLGNYEEALRYYQRLGELVPTDPTSELMQGNCLSVMGRYEDAVPHFRKAYKLTPKGDMDSREQILGQLARVLWILGKRKDAMREIDRMEKIGCETDDVHLIRGHFYLEDSKPMMALVEFNLAATRTKQPNKVITCIFMSYIETEYYASAYEIYKKFNDLYPEDFEKVVTYLAICLLHLDRKKKEFLEAFKTSMEKYPDLTASAFEDFFPKGMSPEEGYDFYRKIIKKKKR